MLDVGLDFGVRVLATDETLSIEDGVVRVHRDLVLGGIADETLGVGERDIGWRRAVALVVRNDLDTIVLPDTDTPEIFDKLVQGADMGHQTQKKDLRVGGTQIDTDGLGHFWGRLGGGGFEDAEEVVKGKLRSSGLGRMGLYTSSPLDVRPSSGTFHLLSCPFQTFLHRVTSPHMSHPVTPLVTPRRDTNMHEHTRSFKLQRSTFESDFLCETASAYYGFPGPPLESASDNSCNACRCKTRYASIPELPSLCPLGLHIAVLLATRFVSYVIPASTLISRRLTDLLMYGAFERRTVAREQFR